MLKHYIPHKVKRLSSPLQILVIEINLQLTFTIVSIYIPPSQNFSLHDLTNIFSNINTPILFLGDVNSWNTLWGSAKNNSRGDTIEQALTQFNLFPLNDGSPTYFSSHASFTNIDVSCCSSQLTAITKWSISDDLHNSDHFPIFIDLHLSPNNVTYKPLKKFLTDKANWFLFSSSVDSELDKHIPPCSSNKEGAQILKAVRTAANKYIPQSRPFPKRLQPPWWNKQLNELRSEKMKAWETFKKNMSTNNLLSFKNLNAKFKREIKKYKKESLKQFTSTINRNTPISDIWLKIKRFSNQHPSKTTNIIRHNDLTLTDPSKIADLFGSEWCKYASNSNFSPEYNKIKEAYSDRTLLLHKPSQNALSIESPITLSELQNCLNHAKGKTPGFDRVSYPMIKMLSSNSKTRLLNLYNNIFNSGNIPHSWKTATIIPIQKPNSKIDAITSYRPISLLSCFSKVLEKIISARLVWFTEKYKLIHPNQVAFKPNKGCDDALLHLDFFISNALSTKNHVSILSIDFEKAFDRIGSHVVIDQLVKWKIGPKILKFIKSFLTCRTFRVRINNSHSKILRMENGIPQGSPLSVILFTIAFNEISRIINQNNKINHCIYADDLYILCKQKDNRQTKNHFETILKNLQSWSLKSGAKLSLNKTKILHICKKHKCNFHNIDINIDSYRIEIVDNLKILGMIFNNKYTWKDHCLLLKKTIATRSNLICYLSNKSFVHINTLVYLTRMLILSKIDYGLYLYGSSPKRTLQILKPIYHQAIRSALYAYRTTPINHLLTESGLPSIENRTINVTEQLLAKLLFSHNSIIDNDIKKILMTKKIPKIKSSIYKALSCRHKYHLELPTHLSPPPNKPPPCLSVKLPINRSLEKYKKADTNTNIFKQSFYSLKDNLLKDNWKIFYTDGSKMDNNVAYAVVDDSGNLVCNKNLPYFSSVFSAEASAILYAIEFSIQSSLKSAIVTDSLSVLKAISNNFSTDWYTINKIRHSLINHRTDIQLIWVPSHISISGNEAADAAAKLACKSAIISEPIFEKIDIKKHIFNIQNSLHHKNKEHLHSLHYNSINPKYTPAIYPCDIEKFKIKIFSRLRLGHSAATHSFIIPISQRLGVY